MYGPLGGMPLGPPPPSFPGRAFPEGGPSTPLTPEPVGPVIRPETPGQTQEPGVAEGISIIGPAEVREPGQAGLTESGIVADGARMLANIREQLIPTSRIGAEGRQTPLDLSEPFDDPDREAHRLKLLHEADDIMSGANNESGSLWSNPNTFDSGADPSAEITQTARAIVDRITAHQEQQGTEAAIKESNLARMTRARKTRHHPFGRSP